MSDISKVRIGVVSSYIGRTFSFYYGPDENIYFGQRGLLVVVNVSYSIRLDGHVDKNDGDYKRI